MDKQNHYRILKERIDIRDYAGYLGYTVVRKGRYYSLKEHDSVRIDPEKNCFWRNSRQGQGGAFGRGGSVIDFVMEFTGADKKQALLALEQYAREPAGKERRRSRTERPAFPEKLQLPERAPDMKRVFAYLIKTRKIRAGIVQDLVHNKQLYQDKNGNCVFVSYRNGVPVFACRRGTSTETPFYGDISGCDYNYCFHISYGAHRLYITESVIDALSVMTLRDNYKDWNYLALTGGGKWNAIQSHMAGMQEIWIGTDQDDMGLAAAKKIAAWVSTHAPDATIVFDLPEKKDWNQILTEGEEKQ